MKLSDSSCPFCKLPPARILTDNPLSVTIRDGFPISPGHTLIIPKRHISSFFDLSESERNDVVSNLLVAKLALDSEFRPHGYNVGINDGLAAGQTISHMHIHLIPRYQGDVEDPRGGIRWLIREKAAYWHHTDLDIAQVSSETTINEGLLSELFAATTTSYKYLFFLSLLKALFRTSFKQPRWDIDEIIRDMVGLAWHPYSRFNLSLGSQDQIGIILDEIPSGGQTEELVDFGTIQARISNSLTDESIKQLKKFVPFRLLAAFFRDELAGVPDQQRNVMVFKLSRQLFNERLPLYRFASDEEIEVHPQWMRYFEPKYATVETWAISQFVEYLIRRNRKAPDFSSSLFSIIKSSA